MARLGKAIFFDTSLSSSGKMSCATCHSPAHAFGPPASAPAMYGGPSMSRQGMRAVPSLMYLERASSFRIGPDTEENEGAQTPAPSASAVPQGGLFWDGRADTLQAQALSPLLNPDEMDGGSIERVARKLRNGPYARTFVELFGPRIVRDSHALVNEALFAVGRYEFEDSSFHPYSSKYDAWLEGKARLSEAEMRGLRAFEDPRKGNCAACHLDRPTSDGLPPLFTDYQYEALGVPRNGALAANRDPRFTDLGVCGPLRRDLRSQTQFCGMFGTPTLRNVATRHVFFHNGRYHTLREVLDFYDFRAVAPQRIYSKTSYEDLPAKYASNVDVVDAPFDRRIGEKPPLTSRDEDDVIAFLRTLTDGYRPKR